MSDTAQLGYLVAAKQTAKGTPNTAGLSAAGAGIYASSIAIGGNSEVTDPDPEIGGSRNPAPGSGMFGGFGVSGEIESRMRFDRLPLLLLAAGFVQSPSAPVQEGTTGAWEHTFVQGVASYLTVESSWGLNRAVRRFQDVLVDTLTMSTEADGETTMAAELLGFTEAWQGSPITPTYPALDAVGSWIGSAITFDALGTYRFSSCEFSLNNNLSDDEYVIGKRTRDDSTPGDLETMFTGTIRLGDNTPSLTDLYRAAMYGSKTATAPGSLPPFETAAAVTFGSGKLIGSSVVNTYRAVVTLPVVGLRAFPLEASGADTLEAEIEARAYGTGVTVKVWNSKGTAY